MRYGLALLCLVVVLVATVGALGTGRRAWGVLLLLASVAWLPLNNGEAEGAILLSVHGRHGLTVADLVGIVGVLVAGLTVWPPRRWRTPGWVLTRLGVLALAIAVGFGLAYLNTDERPALRDHRPTQHPAVRPLDAGGLPGSDNAATQMPHSSGTVAPDTVET